MRTDWHALLAIFAACATSANPISTTFGSTCKLIWFNQVSEQIHCNDSTSAQYADEPRSKNNRLALLALAQPRPEAWISDRAFKITPSVHKGGRTPGTNMQKISSQSIGYHIYRRPLSHQIQPRRQTDHSRPSNVWFADQALRLWVDAACRIPRI